MEHIKSSIILRGSWTGSPSVVLVNFGEFVSCSLIRFLPYHLPQGSAKSPVAPLLITMYFICLWCELPVTKATRSGALQSAERFLHLVRLQQGSCSSHSCGSKRNTFIRIPLCHQFLHNDSETVPFLYIYQLIHFISSNKSWYILIWQHITLPVNLVSSTYFKIRRKKCTNTKTQKQTPNCVGITSNECVCCVEEKNNPNGMFILWAFSLKERMTMPVRHLQ